MSSARSEEDVALPIITDASVLIHLSRIGLFNLLRSLYSELTVSPSVFHEVVEKGWGLPGSKETNRAVLEGWVKVVSVVDRAEAVKIAEGHGIQMANAETVQLANELKSSLVLADEEEVRRLVEECGLEVRGCLGVLVEAARARLITASEAIKAAEELRGSGYRISNKTLKSFREALKLTEGKVE